MTLRIRCSCGWEVEGDRFEVAEVFDKHAGKCWAAVRNTR